MSAPTRTPPIAKPATKPAAKGTADADAEDEPGGGGKKKLLAIVLVALLAVGAGLYFFVFSGSETAAEPAPVPGIVLVLDPVAVNLAGSGYLKVGVTLQLTEEAGETAPDGAKATDIIIETFSGAQLADVTGNRDALKAELTQRIEDAYNVDGADLVMGLYYTQYVTQ